MNDSLKWGTRVRVGGRTMLRPGFSLVGLEGIIVPSAPNTPPGCTTVAVDWEGAGYTPENGYDMESLPLFVNVPQEHLDIVTEEEVAATTQATSRPALSIVKDEPESGTPVEREVLTEPNSPSEPASEPSDVMPATPELSSIPLSSVPPVPSEPESPEEPPTPDPEDRPRLRLI